MSVTHACHACLYFSFCADDLCKGDGCPKFEPLSNNSKCYSCDRVTNCQEEAHYCEDVISGE
jgi:hypothetical protein